MERHWKQEGYWEPPELYQTLGKEWRLEWSR